MSETTGNLRRKFEAHYEAWKQYCERIQDSSLLSSRFQSDDYQKIIEIGPRVLPLLTEKCLQDGRFSYGAWAWLELTKVQNDPAVNPWARDSIRTWWEGGQVLANARFLLLYNRFKHMEASRMLRKSEQARRSIRALGLLPLPAMIQQMEEGETAVLPMIADVVRGLEYDPEHTADAVRRIRSWWKENRKWAAVLPSGKPEWAGP